MNKPSLGEKYFKTWDPQKLKGKVHGGTRLGTSNMAKFPLLTPHPCFFHVPIAQLPKEDQKEWGKK